MANYTELATVKEELGISGVDEDARLTRMIAVASAAIDSYCNQKFHYQEAIEEKLASAGSHILMVSRTPLVAISSITYDGAGVQASDYEIYDNKAGLIYGHYGCLHTGHRQRSLSMPHGPNPRKLYTVTYSGGYKLPGDAERDLPYDIEQACLELVKSYYRAPTSPDIKREEVPDVYSVEYRDTSASQVAGMPSQVASMLNPYKRGIIL